MGIKNLKPECHLEWPYYAEAVSKERLANEKWDLNRLDHGHEVSITIDTEYTWSVDPTFHLAIYTIASLI